MYTNAESEVAAAEQAQDAAGVRNGKSATCVRTSGCGQTHRAAKELKILHRQWRYKTSLRPAPTGEEMSSSMALLHALKPSI